MQTFLPYTDFRKSLQSLDYRRLGKQRVEAMQIHNVLTGNSNGKGWANHPITRMWRGYESALAVYHNIAIEEWVKRGYNNTMQFITVPKNITLPPWVGCKDFHDSHKANLLRKDPTFYGQYGWNVSPDLPYLWMV